MALVGEGKGFKTTIGMGVATVLMTLPLFFLELHSPGLTIAPRADGSLAPVQLDFDRRKGQVHLATTLSTELPEGYPLAIHIRAVAGGGTTLADDFVDRIETKTRYPRVVHAYGPAPPIAATPSETQVTLRFYRGKTKILTVHGRLLPDSDNLVDVRQEKPAVE